MGFVTCNSNLFQQKRAERDAPLAVIRRELAADCLFRDSPVFPAAIEPFEPLSAESGDCLVAENQIGFGYGGIPLFVPSFAHAEISEDFFADIGFERNLDHRMEEFRSLSEARVLARNIEEAELGKLLKKGEVVVEMMNEFGEPTFAEFVIISTTTSLCFSSFPSSASSTFRARTRASERLRNSSILWSRFHSNPISAKKSCDTSTCANMGRKKQYDAVTEADLILGDQAGSRFSGDRFEGILSWLERRANR